MLGAGGKVVDSKGDIRVGADDKEVHNLGCTEALYETGLECSEVLDGELSLLKP